MRVLHNLGVHGANVEDAMQRVFLVLSERIDDVHEGSEKAFLFRTAVNVAKHERRSHARRREVADGEEALEHLVAGLSPEELEDQRRAREILLAILQRLSEE